MTQIIKSILNQGERIGWRALLMQGLVTYSQPLYQRWFRKQQVPWNISTKQLLNYPMHSLGRELGEFLKKYNFSLMAQFESHDVFHVLLGYKPAVLDEARMQYCLLGSGRRSLYTLGTCLIASLIYPDFLLDFKHHYQRGCGLENFSYWDFEAMLSMDIGQVIL